MSKLVINTSEYVQKLITDYNPRGYEFITGITNNQIVEKCLSDFDIHGVIVEEGYITCEEINHIRMEMGAEFPVIVFHKGMTPKEAAEWINCGSSDLIEYPLSIPVMIKRLTNCIKLYCVTRSLSGQTYDNLTGLYKRGAFFHFAKERIIMNPESQYTIVVSDIENFKLVNERYGESKGDEILRYVGKSLGKLNNDSFMFARYGGDQFVGLIVKDNSFSQDCDAPLINGLNSLSDSLPVDNIHVKLGIYDCVDKRLPISIMCDRAVMALNTIKHQYGRVYAKYNPQMQQHFDMEQRILDSMEEALKDNQFKVYYQPKHDIDTSSIIGVEALVRWEHPEYGFMSPGEFIPLFEKSGFIASLDRYVWNTVCEDVNKWLNKGLPVVPVSVNVSRKDLLQEGFIENVEEPLLKYNLDPHLFHLELTESIYMEDAEVLKPIIEELRKKGIRFELDDFGSGFSSLGMLSKLPMDIVKLDVSLVRNIDSYPQIVDSAIYMIHTLGCYVIAEGVESYEQLEQLKEMGCDWVQGYYYSKPRTFNGMIEYIKLYEILQV